MELIGTLLNFAVALATVGLGAFGWLKPTETLEFVGLSPADSSGLGRSEIRAASGAVWVGIGAGAMLINTPLAFLMLGFVYVGAAVGRLTAIILDNARGSKPLWFFTYEAVCAGILFAVNSAGLAI